MRKTNTQTIKGTLTAGYFLSQTLIVGVGQQRTLGAWPHGEMSCRTPSDGVMTRWVEPICEDSQWEDLEKTVATGSLAVNKAHKRPTALHMR